MPEPVVGMHDRALLEPQVLTVIAQLVDELRRGEFRGAVGLGDSLERDLGISSLERVELLLRLEQAFGVRLTDAAMAGADSPRDLVIAILTAEPAATEKLPEIPRTSIAPPLSFSLIPLTTGRSTTEAPTRRSSGTRSLAK